MQHSSILHKKTPENVTGRCAHDGHMSDHMDKDISPNNRAGATEICSEEGG